MANNQLLSSARNTTYRNYPAYYSSELDAYIANDLKRAEMDLNNLEKLTKKDKDVKDKIERQRKKLQKVGSLEDFRKCTNEIGRLHKRYLSDSSYENRLLLKQAVGELEDRLQTLNSLRVSQGGYSLSPTTGKYTPNMPEMAGSHRSEGAHFIGNNQVSVRSYNDGSKPTYTNTSYRDQLYGYGKKKDNTGAVRAGTRVHDKLSTPEARLEFYKNLRNDAPKPDPLALHLVKPKREFVGPLKTDKPASATQAVAGLPDIYTYADHNNFAQGAGGDGVPSTHVATTPVEAVLSHVNTNGGQNWVDRKFARAEAQRNAYANASDWFTQHRDTMRKWRHKKKIKPASEYAIAKFFQDHEDTMRTGEYIPQDPKKIKASEVIAKSLQTLARPIINLVKGIGEIGVQAKNLTVSMSGLADALGNPFNEATLSTITNVGTGFTDTAIGGAGAIGGAISGTGGGIGRAANDTWNFGSAFGGETGKKITKAGAVMGAVSAGLGLIGGAITTVANIVSAGFGISTSLLKSINKLTLKILNTSPIFETIKNILNLAFTMAFLPAMTLLGDKLMPVILNLLNEAVQFGDTLANLFTEERINKIVGAFDKSFKGIIDYFNNHAEELADMVTGMIDLLPDMIDMQRGLIEIFVSNKDRILDLLKDTISVFTSMISGDLLTKALKFAQSATTFIDANGDTILSAVLTISKFIVDIANFLTGSGGKKYQEEQRQAQTEAAQNNDYLGYLAATGKGLVNALTFGRVKLAEGGYVPATPGGVPAIIGEGGEGEYVIPESKLANMGGVTVVFSGNVYGMNDFKQQVRSIMNEYTTKANFR